MKYSYRALSNPIGQFEGTMVTGIHTQFLPFLSLNTSPTQLTLSREGVAPL